MYILYIQSASEDAKKLYEDIASAYMRKPYEDRDAGFDLCSEPCKVTANVRAHKISQQCRAAFYDTERKLFRAFWLLPRSSISKTGMRLANSVGLIDGGYRGDILAAVDNRSSEDIDIVSGSRYFQLAAPDLLPWNEVLVVPEIPGGPTLRGAGGFGSTGVTNTASAGL